MGESRAGDLLLVCVIIFFILSVSLVGWDLIAEIDYTGGEDLDSFEILNRTSCTSPRYYTNGFGNDVRVITSSYRCDQTRGTISQEVCETISGCDWVNVSSWWWFGEDSEKCDGTINITAYDTNVSFGLVKYNVCSLEDLQDNATICYNTGCTFNNEATEESAFSIDAVFESIGSLFTLRYDFGFEDDYEVLNAVFTFFAFYVPLLAVLLSGYFSLPFLH